MKDPKVLEFFEMAKEIYVTGEAKCMCGSFTSASFEMRGYFPPMQMFSFDVASSMFDAIYSDGFWWPLSDRESRIRYFDWLIEQEKIK